MEEIENANVEIEKKENNNTRKIIRILKKNGLITSVKQKEQTENDKKIIKTIVDLMHNRLILRQLLARYDKKTRLEIILTTEMNRIERYIFMSYFNYFMKLKLAKQKGEKIKPLTETAVFNNVFFYFKNAKYQYHDFSKLHKLIKSMKRKALYYSQKENVSDYISKIKIKKEKNDYE
jgi:hypothetical protein